MAIADKFYTNPDIAKKCLNLLLKYIKKDDLFLEPTAGNGSFLNALEEKELKYEAYDLLPEDNRIKKMNIFDFDSDKKDYITIGNPPFGKRSKMAIDVFNKVSNYSKIVAFIVPVSFMKFGVQKNLNKDFKLLEYWYLPPNSFFDREKVYDVNCVFQIWGKEGNDLRLKKAPSVSHKDLELWQYNATKESFNTVYKDWDVAFFRQGYKDYTKIFKKEDQKEIEKMMKKNIQFFFVKTKNQKAKEIVSKMNITSLAARNTSTPGFGKGDFVSYYQELDR